VKEGIKTLPKRKPWYLIAFAPELLRQPSYLSAWASQGDYKRSAESRGSSISPIRELTGVQGSHAESDIGV
jgi:hypothetical protein